MPARQYLTSLWDSAIRLAASRSSLPQLGYGNTDGWVFSALEAQCQAAADHRTCSFTTALHGKDVGVVGSAKPWFEVVSVVMGARSTLVVEYHLIAAPPDSVRVADGAVPLKERLAYVTPDVFGVLQRSARGASGWFDVLLSISSIEHDGLGR